MILFAAVLSVFAFVGLRHPTAMAVLFLLAQTKFLGFLDLETLIMVSNFAAGSLCLTLACLVAAPYWLSKSPRLQGSLLFLTIGLLAFFAYGMIRATWLDPSLGILVFVEGKHFASICFLVYLLCAKDWIDTSVVFKALRYTALYLALVIIAYQLTGISPPEYLTVNYSGEYQRVAHPTIMALGFLISFVSESRRPLWKHATSIVLLIGISMAGHLALFFAVAAVAAAYWLITNFQPEKVAKRWALTAYWVCALFGLFATYQLDVLRSVGAWFGVDPRSIEGSVLGRSAQNVERWRQVEADPLVGKGFLHGSSEVLSGPFGASDNRFLNTYSVIDAGYLNLILFFGLIGTTLYLWLWYRSAKSVLLSSRDKLAWVAMLFMCAMALANITWAPLSFTFGLVPMFLALWLPKVEQKPRARRRKRRAKVGLRTFARAS